MTRLCLFTVVRTIVVFSTIRQAIIWTCDLDAFGGVQLAPEEDTTCTGVISLAQGHLDDGQVLSNLMSYYRVLRMSNGRFRSVMSCAGKPLYIRVEAFEP